MPSLLPLLVVATALATSPDAAACANVDGGAGRIECWMRADGPVANGFSTPRGAGRTILAIADGVVSAVEGDSLEVRHTFYENHHRREVTFSAQRLERTFVTQGESVRRGQRLARSARLARATPSASHVFVDGADAHAFVARRRALAVPQREAVLVVVDVDGHRAVRFERGVPMATYEVAQGQAPGPKERQGDLKTPRGAYYVVDRYAGEFDGPVGAYYGGHWIKVNYPNAFDAERGLRDGLVSIGEARRITDAWRRRMPTPQRTALGGGIGFHGWIAEWSGESDGYLLSWGCVVLHLSDIAAFYAAVPLGAMVVFI